MKKQVSIYVFLIIAMVTGCANDRGRDQLINEVFEVSGYAGELKQYPVTLLEVSNRVFTRQNVPVNQEKLKQSINEIGGFDKLHKAALAEIKSNFAADANYLKSVADSFKSPLVNKMMTLETQSTTAEAQQAMQAYLLDAKSIVTDPERQALINGLISTRRAAKRYVDLGGVIAESVYVSAAKSLSREDIEKIVQQLRQDLAAEAQAVLPLQYQFIYRDVNNSELKQYIEFYKRDEIQKYIALTQVISEKLLAASVKQIVGQTVSASPQARNN